MHPYRNLTPPALAGARELMVTRRAPTGLALLVAPAPRRRAPYSPAAPRNRPPRMSRRSSGSTLAFYRSTVGPPHDRLSQVHTCVLYNNQHAAQTQDAYNSCLSNCASFAISANSAKESSPPLSTQQEGGEVREGGRSYSEVVALELAAGGKIHRICPNVKPTNTRAEFNSQATSVYMSISKIRNARARNYARAAFLTCTVFLATRKSIVHKK
jgi:hypothetical protein